MYPFALTGADLPGAEFAGPKGLLPFADEGEEGSSLQPSRKRLRLMAIAQAIANVADGRHPTAGETDGAQELP
jgi:hypothetical protein